MIEIDGIKLTKVTKIEYSKENGFRPIIYFLHDDRLDAQTDLSKLEDYEVLIYKEQDHENIGIAMVILGKNTELKFITGK